jgi:hypothetical protein
MVVASLHVAYGLVAHFTIKGFICGVAQTFLSVPGGEHRQECLCHPAIRK